MLGRIVRFFPFLLDNYGRHNMCTVITIISSGTFMRMSMFATALASTICGDAYTVNMTRPFVVRFNMIIITTMTILTLGAMITVDG